MKLVDIYDVPGYLDMLYRLLKERTADQSISHKEMPTFGEHRLFVTSKPYPAWYAAYEGPNLVGSVYLSHEREIGVAIFNRYQHRGLGEQAVRMLMAKHPGTFLANVNPKNDRSASMFKRIGFDLIQHTYAYRGETDAQARQAATR